MLNRAFALLLVFVLAGAAYAGGAKKSYLTRPDGAPDVDAEGWVKAKDGKKVDLLEVAARNVDGGTTLDVFLEDADGVMQDVGDLVVDEGKTGGKWKINTRRGDLLPFAAESVADLFGRAVEVRDGEGNVLLAGSIKGALGKKSALALAISASKSMSQPVPKAPSMNQSIESAAWAMCPATE